VSDSTEAITRVSGDSAVQSSLATHHTASISVRATDTVALSDTAKAKLLRDQGETVEEIASELNLSVSQIISDLQIAATAAQTSAAATSEIAASKKQ
jgi:hypothetical protein